MSNCSSYTSSANSLMSTLDSLSSSLDSSYSKFSTSMTSAFNTYALSGEGASSDSIISSLGDYANQQLAEATTAVEDSTGNNECLNAIINGVSAGLSNIIGYGESLIGDATSGLLSTGSLDSISGMLLGSIPGYSEFVSAFNSSGIPDIIAAADQIINCIDTSSCGTASEVDSMINKVDSFTSKFGLDIYGNFNLSSWITNTVTNIGNLADKLTGFTDKISNLFSGYGSWQTGFQSSLGDFMYNTTGMTMTGTYGSVGAAGSIGSVTDFAGTAIDIGGDIGDALDSSSGSTTGTKAQPIHSEECDCWDKTKQTDSSSTA